MTEIKSNALVIGEKELGENDKLLTLLVERYGKVVAVAKGAKSVRNRHMASCQLFSYASFGLRKRGNLYYVTDTDLAESYYDIRTDITKLALASYMCDVINDVVQEGECEDEILKLSLNTFYAIAKNLKPLEFIRACFQLRIAVIAGFTPNFDGCVECGNSTSKFYYFDIVDGIIYCDSCKNKLFYASAENEFLERGLSKPIAIISESVLAAMQYVIGARRERFLSFNLEEDELSSFYSACEKFLLNQLERGFYSLGFYKSLI